MHINKSYKPVRHIDAAVHHALHHSENLATSCGARQTNIKNRFERSATVLILNGEVLTSDLEV